MVQRVAQESDEAQRVRDTPVERHVQRFAQRDAADHTVFVCSDGAAAKARVTEPLRSFGCTDIIDLRDITTARGTEMLFPIWMRLFGVPWKPIFNFKIVR